MKKLKELGGELAERMELPEDAALGAARLTVTAKKQVLVENHRGILEYGGELIRLSSTQGELVIRGSGLHLLAMNKREVLIGGRFHMAEWE